VRVDVYAALAKKVPAILPRYINGKTGDMTKALEAFVSVAQAAGVKDSAVSRNNSSTHPVTNVLNREMRNGETVMLVLVDISVSYYSLVAKKLSTLPN
jgi:hypothetical protein